MSYVSQVLADGAVGFWELSEASGTVAIDQTGNGNGIYNPAGTFGQPGIPGGGGLTAMLLAAASGQYAYVNGGNPSQYVGDVFTFEAWVKRTTTGTAQGIFGSNGDSFVAQMRFNSSDQLILSGVANSSSSLIDTTDYHHLVATKNGVAVHLYIDGADVTVLGLNQTFTNSGSGYAIGATFGGGAFFLDGTLAMVALYPTALSSAQVLNHYNLGNPPPSGYPPVSVLVPQSVSNSLRR